MADWRTILTGRGSFRGAAFRVESDELAGSQGTAKHEIANSDRAPYIEPTGKDGDEFSIDAFVIGDNFLTDRDALLKELSKSQPGELVHPSYGTKRVMAMRWRVRQSYKEGGWAKLSIDFAETADPAAPSTTVDGSSIVQASASAAQAAVGSEFLATFSDDLTLARDTVTGALSSAARAVSTVLSRVSMVDQTLAGIQRSASNLETNATSVAGQGAGLLDTMSNLVETLGDGLIEANPVHAVARLLDLYNFNPGVRPPGSSAERLAEQANFDATQRLIQRLVVVKAATVAIVQTFVSYDDAVRARDSITNLIDAQAEIAADDTFPSLQQLRSDLINAVPGETSDLPRLLPFTPPVTVPSLVLAHRLYGDLALEQDVIGRNKIRHPGFVQGAVELEILSRE